MDGGLITILSYIFILFLLAAISIYFATKPKPPIIGGVYFTLDKKVKVVVTNFDKLSVKFDYICNIANKRGELKIKDFNECFKYSHTDYEQRVKFKNIKKY